jgi:hypothetical protein
MSYHEIELTDRDIIYDNNDSCDLTPEDYFIQDLTRHITKYPKHNDIICVIFGVGCYVKRILKRHKAYKYSICYAGKKGVNIQDEALFIKKEIESSSNGAVIYAEKCALNIMDSFTKLTSGGYFCGGIDFLSLTSACIVECEGNFMLSLQFDTESG